MGGKEHDLSRPRGKRRDPVGRVGGLPEGAEVRVELAAAGKEEFDRNAPPIEEKPRAIWADVPQDEWDRLPADLSEHLDHYIYGTPR